ncbi:HTH domain-containing protein [Salinibaculum salinum]|uniref:HTH domain-containing protein n=1 Tax=Salinibaculum salinum TaxID=3131996 RepID=UPI0030EC5F60
MHSNKREGSIEVVLYERTELPPPAAERADCVHDRLVELEENGHVDAVTREEWVKRTPVEDCDDELRDTYLSFESWADEEGVRLTPFFQTRECFSSAAGEHTDWLVMPAFCLAVYDGDDVSAIYPHNDDEDGAKTVEDGLQALIGEDLSDATPEALAAD